MITSVIIQGMPRTGTTVMLDLFRHSSWIQNVFPETLTPEQLEGVDSSWVWKYPVYCLETERIQELCPLPAVIFMTRNLRDCLMSWHYYPDAEKTLLMPAGYKGVEGYIRLWQDYTRWVETHAHRYGMVVRLEDLILNKWETVRSVLRWLHMPFEQSMRDFVRHYISDRPVDDYPYPHQTSPVRKVNGWKDVPHVLERYKKELDNVDIADAAETA